MDKSTTSSLVDNGHGDRCCCEIMHVQTGSILIGVIEICAVLGQLAYLIAMSTEGVENKTELVYSLGGMIVALASVASMFYGISKQRSTFLVPHLSFQLLTIIVFMLAATFLLVWSILELRQDEPKSPITFSLVVAGIFYIMAVFEVWFFVVVLSCYRLIRDRNKFSPQCYDLVIEPIKGYGTRHKHERISESSE